MAHIEPMGVDALGKMYEGLKTLTTDIDRVVKKCVDEASPTGERAYKGAMQGAGLPRRVSTAVDTLNAKRNEMGIFTVSRAVGFREFDGLRYAALAAYFNYGTKEHVITRKLKSGKTVKQTIRGMAGTHWHDRAVSAAEVPVTKIVQETFDKEVKRLTT